MGSAGAAAGPLPMSAPGAVQQAQLLQAQLAVLMPTAAPPMMAAPVAPVVGPPSGTNVALIPHMVIHPTDSQDPAAVFAHMQGIARAVGDYANGAEQALARDDAAGAPVAPEDRRRVEAAHNTATNLARSLERIGDVAHAMPIEELRAFDRAMVDGAGTLRLDPGATSRVMLSAGQVRNPVDPTLYASLLRSNDVLTASDRRLTADLSALGGSGDPAALERGQHLSDLVAEMHMTFKYLRETVAHTDPAQALAASDAATSAWQTTGDPAAVLHAVRSYVPRGE